MRSATGCVYPDIDMIAEAGALTAYSHKDGSPLSAARQDHAGWTGDLSALRAVVLSSPWPRRLRNGDARARRRGQADGMITIYGDAISGNCLKVKWTAQRLGVPFRWIDVDVTRRETRTAAVSGAQPGRPQVPTVVLEDGRPPRSVQRHHPARWPRARR